MERKEQYNNLEFYQEGNLIMAITNSHCIADPRALIAFGKDIAEAKENWRKEFIEGILKKGETV